MPHNPDDYVTLTVVVRRDGNGGDPVDLVIGVHPDVRHVGTEDGITDTAFRLGADPSSWADGEDGITLDTLTPGSRWVMREPNTGGAGTNIVITGCRWNASTRTMRVSFDRGPDMPSDYRCDTWNLDKFTDWYKPVPEES